MIFGYIFLAIAGYFAYGIRHSVGNSGGWDEQIRLSEKELQIADEVHQDLLSSHH